MEYLGDENTTSPELETGDIPLAVKEIVQRSEKLQLEDVPADLSKELVDSLFRKINSHDNQSYSFDKNTLDHDKSMYYPTKYGGIFIAHESTGNDSVAIIIHAETDKDPGKIIGYGGMELKDGESTATFKIFPEDRGKVPGKQAFLDLLSTAAIASASSPKSITMPKNQQYNAAIETDATPAPIIYRKLGFRGKGDSPALVDKINNKENLSSEELKQLANNPVSITFNQEDQGCLDEDRDRILSHSIPLDNDNTQILEGAIIEKQKAKATLNMVERMKKKLES